MAKSYILKDSSGKAAGYVQQVEDRIRCGLMDESRAEGELWLFFDHGKWSRRPLNSGIGEQEWTDDGASLLGACIACGERRLADTGEEARLLFAARQRGGSQHEKRTAAAKSVSAQELHAPEKAQREPESLVPALPQRRWPPQPCCAHAYYVDGAWRLREPD